MNTVENMTFLKKNSTGKETFISEMTKKDLDKSCLLKVSSVIKNNKINEFSNELKKINTHINKTLRNSISNKKRSVSYHTKHSSINPKVCLSLLSKEKNDTNSNSSSNNIKNLLKKSFTKNEKLIYNSFTNLETTQENSFQLNSSYDNINKISNNKYIKDINLQLKIKQILIECSYTNNIKKKPTFLKLPFNACDITPKSCKKNNSLFHSFLNEAKTENNISELTNKKNSNNSVIYKSGTKTENEEEIDSNKKIKRGKLDSASKILQVKGNEKLISTRNIIDLRKIKSPTLEHRKLKKKKKPEKINKQLNIISKNIKNSSKNINNPQEFYFNLFNDIISKESKMSNDEESNIKSNNTLNKYSDLKKPLNKKESNKSNKSYKSRNIEQNSNSFFSNSNVKDSNFHLIRPKTKRKSGFNMKIQ